MDVVSNVTNFFVAQEVVCSYPMSDFYGPSPRYLYYGMLVAMFFTHWHGWLVNVFLGACATYAGTAAIQAFILMSSSRTLAPEQSVSILPVSSANITKFGLSPSNLGSIVMDTMQVLVQPDVIELDVDAITAIVVVGFLVGLPMQCWSRVTRTRRILHVLIFIWNFMMLAATICTLLLWPTLNTARTQYRFCIPYAPDDDSTTNNGWQSDVWRSDWNATINHVFLDQEGGDFIWTRLPSNCLYPCFNTTQILRKPTSITATLNATSEGAKSLHIANRDDGDPFLPFIYGTVAAFTVAYVFLVVAERLRRNRRFPMDEPILLWIERRSILRTFVTDFKTGIKALVQFVRAPRSALHGATPASTTKVISSAIVYILDVITLLVVLGALFLCPLTIVCFISWIEWYIRHDGPTSETAQQVGQWTTPVSLALVLIAALILQLRYKVASETEIRRDIESARKTVEDLEHRLVLKLEAKQAKKAKKGGKNHFEDYEMDLKL